MDQLDQGCRRISALHAWDAQFEENRQARIKAVEEGVALHQAIQEYEQASAASVATATAAAVDAREKQVAKMVDLAAKSEVNQGRAQNPSAAAPDSLRCPFCTSPILPDPVVLYPPTPYLPNPFH